MIALSDYPSTPILYTPVDNNLAKSRKGNSQPSNQSPLIVEDEMEIVCVQVLCSVSEQQFFSHALFDTY